MPIGRISCLKVHLACYNLLCMLYSEFCFTLYRNVVFLFISAYINQCNHQLFDYSGLFPLVSICFARQLCIFTTCSELQKGSVFGTISLWGFFWFVCEISREPLNGFAPNSHGRHVWSLAWTSFKVTGEGHQGQKRPACGLCLVKHLQPLLTLFVCCANMCYLPFSYVGQ